MPLLSMPQTTRVLASKAADSHLDHSQNGIIPSSTSPLVLGGFISFVSMPPQAVSRGQHARKMK